MSGTDIGYGEGIHDAIENLKMPEDDGITTSSFENSKIENNKSLTMSRRMKHRGNENVSKLRQI